MRLARVHAGRPLLRRRPAFMAGVLLGTTLLLTNAACSSSEPEPGPNQPSTALPAPSSETPTSPTSSGAPTDPAPDASAADPQDGPTPTGSASQVPDPEAPSTFRPVERPGTAGAKPVPVADAASNRVRWQDGLTLAVSDVRRSTTGGRGRGSQPGRPQTTFTVTVDNQSNAVVDVSRVVLSVTYGRPRRLAQRIYDTSTSDFAGAVRPQTKEQAVYAFVIPKARTGAALVVDLDGKHAVATLKGVAR